MKLWPTITKRRRGGHLTIGLSPIGDWDEEEIAQRKADLFFEELGIKKRREQDTAYYR